MFTGIIEELGEVESDPEKQAPFLKAGYEIILVSSF